MNCRGVSRFAARIGSRSSKARILNPVGACQRALILKAEQRTCGGNH